MPPGSPSTVLVALGLLASPAPAPAPISAPVSAPGASKGVELRWDVPESCPDEAALRRQVEGILGVPLDTPRARPLAVTAVVRDDDGTRSLRIFTVTPEGMRERALRYDRYCTVLTRAAAVLIAITIDPTSVGRLDPKTLALLDAPPPEPPPVEVEVEAAPIPSPVEVPVEVPPPVAPPPVIMPVITEPPVSSRARASPRPRWRPARPRGAVRVLAGVGVGDLPGAGGGLGGAASLLFRRLRIDLVVALWPGRKVRVAGTDAGADFLLWTVGPRLCGVLHPHRLLELPLCAGLEAGRIHAAAVGLGDGDDPRVTWVAAVLAPALVVTPLRRLGLWLGPELVVPATRTRFRVAGPGTIYRANAAAVRVVAGIELRFP